MTIKTNITNQDDLIDSRDVIERIEELTDVSGSLAYLPGEEEELASLQALADEAEQCAEDWAYGEVLIRFDHFVTYAQELADDLGRTPDPNQWPLCCIDWDQAADQIKQDYTEVDFDGVAYLIR